MTANGGEGGTLVERSALHLEPPTRHQVVRVEASHQRRAAFGYPRLQCSHDAAMRTRNDPHPGLSPCEFRGERACVVGRTIIDDDALPIGFGLALHATQRKVERVRKLIDASGRDIRLQVDGGIKVDNIRRVADAGADTFVAGSAIFGQADYRSVIAAMRAELG